MFTHALAEFSYFLLACKREQFLQSLVSERKLRSTNSAATVHLIRPGMFSANKMFSDSSTIRNCLYLMHKAQIRGSVARGP